MPGSVSARNWALAAVVLAILASAAVRLRLADVPLERDEGEYAYAGRLLLEGEPPYREAYNMKFPGTYYAYAGILALFGETPRAIHLGLLLVNATSVALVFILGRQLLGAGAGAAAAATFAVLSLDRWVMGVFAHATHFVVLPVLAALVLLLGAGSSGVVHRGRLLAAGALLGVAVLMKQHAALFLPLGLAVALRRGSRRGWRDALVVALGAAVPAAVLVVVFASQGVLGAFFFWTFAYAREYVTAVPLSRFGAALATGFTAAARATLPFWGLAGVGLVLLWVDRWTSEARVVLTGLAAAGFLAVCPGLYFREHYFIVLLPATALLAGVAVASLAGWAARWTGSRRAVPLAVAAWLVLAGLYAKGEWHYLVGMTPRDLSRERYGSNPFVESEEIARYVRDRTAPGDRIAVLGSEPQIFFYAQRRSATGYIYMYPLMEEQRFAARMQDEMIRQVEAAAPPYLVFAQIGASWLPRTRSEPRLMRWANEFARRCYDLVGVADIHSKDRTTYVWEEEARAYKPASRNLVYVFRRRGAGTCRVELP